MPQESTPMPLQRQAILGLSLPESITFAHYWPGENEAIVQALQTLISAPLDRYLLLWGEQHVGKTYCLKASCFAANQAGLSQVYIPLSKHATLHPDMLQGLETLDVVCLDDLEAIAGISDWEEALFHFYNRFLQQPASCYLVEYNFILISRDGDFPAGTGFNIFTEGLCAFFLPMYDKYSSGRGL